MSLYPIIWALEHAPVIDAEERAILAALVMKGDFDGCNCWRSFATLARIARVDRRTAMRKVQAMTDRGLMREQPGPKPAAWLKLPKDKRPVVREVMVPASFWSAIQLAEINEQRAERGRPPVTPANRPDLPDAPPKKKRTDAGVANPKRSRKKASDDQDERGVSKSPRPEMSEVSTSHLAECLEDTSRGVSETPNLLIAPSDSSSSSLPPEPTEPQPKQEDEEEKKKTPKTNPNPKPSAVDIVAERLSDHPDGPATREEADAVLDLIETHARRRGTTIRSIAAWVTNRDVRDLRRDLTTVRAHGPSGSHTTANVCSLHPGRKTLPCRPCHIAARGGLWEFLQPELDRAGPDGRPDLAALFEARDTKAA